MKTIKFYSMLLCLSLFAQYSLAQQKEVSAKFSGQILEAKSDMVYLYEEILEEGKMIERVADSSGLSKDGMFSMTVVPVNVQQYTFYDGNEVLTVLLKAGDDVHLQLHTAMFDETTSYTGKGAEKNNAVIGLALVNEKIQEGLWEVAERRDTAEVSKYLEENYDMYQKIMSDYSRVIPDLKSYVDIEKRMLTDEIADMKSMIFMDIKLKQVVEQLKGTEAIDIKGRDLEGNEISLSKFKGKTIVLDFWATWCGPCKAEMPAWKELLDKYEGDEVALVNVGVWCKEEGWRKMAKDFGLVNNIYVEQGAESQFDEYMIRFIPRYIVIDKNFKIIDAMAPRPSSGELQELF